MIAKIHGRDYLGIEGNTQEENLYVAKGLVERGLTALDISWNNLVRGSGPSYPDIHYEEDQTYFAKDAKYIGVRIDIPLIVTGGNRSPRVMEAALKENPNLEGFGMART
ncbi:hypothetical protein [Shewanella youngdeokensis]|uniref:NADH:flavin oxidoreductase/NADH oxidase N-terminal domain-containing protein n=1 Tax=Shewanella youngdeokensis TaxID=2999068 RepID=A0ABZ0JTX5_9GAMM|nr:hypothetical protein RGE70_09515 [Shewanella sp. DAU334]